MAVRIPEEDRSTLREWMMEDEKPFDAVIAALRDLPPGRFRALAAPVARSANIDKKIATALLDVFYNLVLAMAGRRGEERDEVEESVFRQVAGRLADAEKLQRFRSRMRQVLELDAVTLSSKALSVLHDNARTFCEARVLTDIRPVFTEDSDLAPKAAVVVHELKIIFHEGVEQDRKQVFVSLRREDLVRLRVVLERALAKHDRVVETSKGTFTFLY